MSDSDDVHQDFIFHPQEGFISICMSTFFIVLQCWYCWILHNRRLYGFGPKFATTIMLFISVFDLSQLISHIYAGLQLFVGYQLPGIWFFAGMVIASWNTVAFVLCFFVFHRFIYLVFPLYADKIMSKYVQVGCLCFCALIHFIQMTLSCTVWYSVYNTTTMHWTLQSKKSDFMEVKYFINSVSNYLVVVFNLPFYVLIIISLILRRFLVDKLLLPSNIIYFKKRFAKTMNSMDIWVILQMLMFWLYAVFTCYVWEYTEYSDEPFFNYLRGTFIWICWNGSKPASTILACLLKRSLISPKRKNTIASRVAQKAQHSAAGGTF